MNKQLTFILVFILPLIHFGQDYSALWKGYFSYNNIVDVTQSSTKIYAAADNAIFSYDIATQNIEELTTINGLSGEAITTIHYSCFFTSNRSQFIIIRRMVYSYYRWHCNSCIITNFRSKTKKKIC